MSVRAYESDKYFVDISETRVQFWSSWESPHEGTAIKVFSLWPLGSDEMISFESITAFGADVQYKWPILPVTEQYFLESTQYFK